MTDGALDIILSVKDQQGNIADLNHLIMGLINLPEEILLIIVRQLDLRSIINLYDTCTFMRRIVSMHGVIRECCLSLNTMATAQSLKLNFFKDISGHLLKLNLSGVHDLNKSSLLPALKKLRSLQALNIAYTKINMLHFLDIYKLCPTIIDITMNFGFDNILVRNVIACFQECFKNIKNVHFVGHEIDLLKSGLSQLILHKAELNNLRFTAWAQKQPTFHFYEEANNFVYKCKYFKLYLQGRYLVEHTHATRHILDSDLFEFLIITATEVNDFTVYASKTFEKYLLHNFGISAECSNVANKRLSKNLVFMAWDKKTNDFDDTFFSNVLLVMKKYFPSNYQTNGISLNKRLNQKTGWYFIRQTFQNEPSSDNGEVTFKKRRIVPPNVILNYDEMCQEETICLNITFDDHFRNPVTLPSGSHYLKKLTYLSLTGTVTYSLTFFNILFRCCDKLVTLNVEAPSVSPCAAAISRSLPLTQTVKNLRIVDKRINFKSLFSSFSQCQTLENVHILDVANECNELADPSVMFEKCDNLYFLLIHASMSNNMETIFNKAKNRSRKPHLNIELVRIYSSDSSFLYAPFVCFNSSVFQLNPIRY